MFFTNKRRYCIRQTALNVHPLTLAPEDNGTQVAEISGKSLPLQKIYKTKTACLTIF